MRLIGSHFDVNKILHNKWVLWRYADLFFGAYGMTYIIP